MSFLTSLMDFCEAYQFPFLKELLNKKSYMVE